MDTTLLDSFNKTLQSFCVSFPSIHLFTVLKTCCCPNASIKLWVVIANLFSISDFPSSDIYECNFNTFRHIASAATATDTVANFATTVNATVATFVVSSASATGLQMLQVLIIVFRHYYYRCPKNQKPYKIELKKSANALQQT